MKLNIRRYRAPAVPLGNPFPSRHCSLCSKGAAISRDSRHRLVDKGRRFKAREALARQDEAANMLFVTHEGYCKSSMECGDNDFIDRLYALGNIMTPGTAEGGKYPTTIKATTTAGVCHVDIARLFKVAEKDPLVAIAVIKFLYRNNGFIVGKLRRYTNKHARARIAAFLVKFYEMYLRTGRLETTLRLLSSRGETASYLDPKIETVSRSLKLLEQQNLITSHRVRAVTINSYFGLKRLIQFSI